MSAVAARAEREARSAFRHRLQSKVRRRSGGCLEWVGYRDRDGYGRASVGERRWQAHRLSWTLHYGPIPSGLCVVHICDNPSCVSIDHLMLGTQAQNVLDRDRKGRGKVPVRRKGRWTGEVRVSLQGAAGGRTD